MERVATEEHTTELFTQFMTKCSWLSWQRSHIAVKSMADDDIE
jgi:hypothetical protein